ncbi:MAG: OOP family OmpA-OmpF porin [Arenicella sp.]|jgi:OOP family OmpA-OmpF porin
MKHCSLFCAGIWPLLLFPLLILIPLLYLNWSAIEQDVADNAALSLTPDHNWAKPETYNNGRDVLLTGTAPNTESISQAVQITIQANGVRTVQFIGDIAPPDPFSLEIRNLSGKLILAGALANQQAIDTFVNAAIVKHGAENIVNQLTVGRNIADIESAGKLLIATDFLTEGASVSVRGDELSLHGKVETETTKVALQDQLASVFAGKINNLLLVVPPPLVENGICQELLNQLLDSARINFESGNASITQDSNGLIQNIANTAKRCPDAKFEVAGHTDSIGTTDLNMELSTRRAMAVVEAVMQLGLTADRFTTRGYGATQAIDDNANAEGRAANRRIEFTIKN